MSLQSLLPPSSQKFILSSTLISKAKQRRFYAQRLSRRATLQRSDRSHLFKMFTKSSNWTHPYVSVPKVTRVAASPFKSHNESKGARAERLRGKTAVVGVKHNGIW